MSAPILDRITGAALLAVAVVWIVLVFMTIEPSTGLNAGPRAFPLFFGIALAGLALTVLVQGIRAQEADEPRHMPAPPREAVAVAASIGAIVVYGALLEPLGFIPSTTLVVAALMLFVLRVRAPLTIAAMALGLSLGSYLIFGKLLGTYLPPGTRITIYL